MNEHTWNDYLVQLAQAPKSTQAHCVLCWYETHTTPFPSHDSSSLCVRHAVATRQTHHCQRREEVQEWTPYKPS